MKNFEKRWYKLISKSLTINNNPNSNKCWVYEKQNMVCYKLSNNTSR